MTHLHEYLSQRRLRQIDFAQRLGIGQATVSRLVSGVMRPSLELAVQIERETGGAVPAVSWVPEVPVTNSHQSSPSSSPENAGGVS